MCCCCPSTISIELTMFSNIKLYVFLIKKTRTNVLLPVTAYSTAIRWWLHSARSPHLALNGGHRTVKKLIRFNNKWLTFMMFSWMMILLKLSTGKKIRCAVRPNAYVVVTCNAEYRANSTDSMATHCSRYRFEKYAIHSYHSPDSTSQNMLRRSTTRTAIARPSSAWK